MVVCDQSFTNRGQDLSIIKPMTISLKWLSCDSKWICWEADYKMGQNKVRIQAAFAKYKKNNVSHSTNIWFLFSFLITLQHTWSHVRNHGGAEIPVTRLPNLKASEWAFSWVFSFLIPELRIELMASCMLNPSSGLHPIPRGNSRLFPHQHISVSPVEGGKFSCASFHPPVMVLCCHGPIAQ